jgi:hypothetical protein
MGRMNDFLLSAIYLIKQSCQVLKETLKNIEIPFETTNDRIYNEAFGEKLRKSDASFPKG